jgi:molecular chaperone DnaJ
VVIIVDHYERLGVAPSATRDDIRSAYRNLARLHHPDAKGDASAVRMAQINEAWRVLSDPGRRAVYDMQLDGSMVGSQTSSARGPASRPPPTETVGRPDRPPPPATPARFPWRFMLIIASLGIAFILVNAALTKPGQPQRSNNLIDAGSCVNFADNNDAVEVACDGSNQGVVVSFRASDSACSQGTEEHRDRQGMGEVCVRLTAAGR